VRSERSAHRGSASLPGGTALGARCKICGSRTQYARTPGKTGTAVPVVPARTSSPPGWRYDGMNPDPQRGLLFIGCCGLRRGAATVRSENQDRHPERTAAAPQPSGSRGRLRRRRGVLADVADEPRHVVGDEPADGAAGVEAHHVAVAVGGHDQLRFVLRHRPSGPSPPRASGVACRSRRRKATGRSGK
jgi:hypothetical protein